ncbi:hypothetical protein Dimus_018504 [Dionaea muscipula]
MTPDVTTNVAVFDTYSYLDSNRPSQLCSPNGRVNPKSSMIPWIKPPSGWIKINFDGSYFMKNRTGGLGLIARSHLEQFLDARTKPIPHICEALVFECLAARESLVLATEFN